MKIYEHALTNFELSFVISDVFHFSYSVTMHPMRKYSAEPQRICTNFNCFCLLWKCPSSKKENTNKWYNRETDSSFSWKILDGHMKSFYKNISKIRDVSISFLNEKKYVFKYYKQIKGLIWILKTQLIHLIQKNNSLAYYELNNNFFANFLILFWVIYIKVML